MKETIKDKSFLYLEDREISFDPIDDKMAKETYLDLCGEINELKRNIDVEKVSQRFISDNDKEKARSVKEEITFLLCQLRNVERKLKIVLTWYNQNNLPYPHSPKDKKSKDQIAKLIKSKLTIIRENTPPNQKRFTKVADWEKLNVYLKKSNQRYIRFEYPPTSYNNDELKTNELYAGDTKFTGAKGKNKPYKIMESFIKDERVERYDNSTEISIAKCVSKLNKFFMNHFENSTHPITSDKDGLYGYTSRIKFNYL